MGKVVAFPTSSAPDAATQRVDQLTLADRVAIARSLAILLDLHRIPATHRPMVLSMMEDLDGLPRHIRRGFFENSRQWLQANGPDPESVDRSHYRRED
jgi:hypothetical protein